MLGEYGDLKNFVALMYKTPAYIFLMMKSWNWVYLAELKTTHHNAEQTHGLFWINTSILFSCIICFEHWIHMWSGWNFWQLCFLFEHDVNVLSRFKFKVWKIFQSDQITERLWSKILCPGKFKIGKQWQ